MLKTMFGDGSLSFREFASREPLPLATIHDATLDFLRNRSDVVLCGAQAVNAYVDEARMTQDVDILSTRARELAEELREHLAQRFAIVTSVREIAQRQVFHIDQLRQLKNRHLADVRHVASFPPTQVISEVRVLIPEELIEQKVASLANRLSQPKSGTDIRDLKMLLLAVPSLKSETGLVADRLRAAGASEQAFAEWHRLVATEFEATDDDEGY